MSEPFLESRPLDLHTYGLPRIRDTLIATLGTKLSRIFTDNKPSRFDFPVEMRLPYFAKVEDAPTTRITGNLHFDIVDTGPTDREENIVWCGLHYQLAERIHLRVAGHLEELLTTRGFSFDTTVRYQTEIIAFGHAFQLRANATLKIESETRPRLSLLSRNVRLDALSLVTTRMTIDSFKRTVDLTQFEIVTYLPENTDRLVSEILGVKAEKRDWRFGESAVNAQGDWLILIERPEEGELARFEYSPREYTRNKKFPVFSFGKQPVRFA